MGWHYYPHLVGSNDISLGFTIASDFVYRWNVEVTGNSFEISHLRWARIGWFAPADNVIGDPTLPDGLYILPLQWLQHLQGANVTEGVALDGGIGDVHVDLYPNVQITLAIFTP
jgi:hypothetical protein